MRLGLALSGGGIRGIAHAGVLKGLEENNIKIDIIGGTSSGGLISALYAMGYSPYYIYILFKRYAKDILTINNGPIVNGISNYMMNKKVELKGLKTGDSLEKMFEEIASRKNIKKISDIKMQLVILTVDISKTNFNRFEDIFQTLEGNRINTYEWLNIDSLDNITLYPRFLKDEIKNQNKTLKLIVTKEY